jgi:hypothetical protein
MSTDGYTAASASIDGGVAYGTFANDVIAVDIAAKKVLALRRSQSAFPFYSSVAISGGAMVLSDRDKQVRAVDLKPRWTFLRASFVARHRRRPRRRGSRRQARRAGSVVRKKIWE